MKFTLPIVLLSALCSVTAVPVPPGSGIAVTNLPGTNQLRIYRTDFNNNILEIDTTTPTTGILNDRLIFPGTTRAKSPLAAVSWNAGNKEPEIRVYYIRPDDTIGEIGFTPGQGWSSGFAIGGGFRVQAGSSALYAVKDGNFIIVGYSSDTGVLSEAYFEIGSQFGWRSYVV